MSEPFLHDLALGALEGEEPQVLKGQHQDKTPLPGSGRLQLPGGQEPHSKVS